jgi:hypothetical protein
MSASAAAKSCGLRWAALAIALSSSTALAAPAPKGDAAATVHSFVVLREYGGGTPSRAQPYLDQLLAVVAKQNGWSKVPGRYFAERAPALEFVNQEKPAFGIFSLAAFLNLKGSLSLGVVGEVVAPKAGGSQYYLVSKRAQKLEECKGLRLTTTFTADAKFIDRVVARGAFTLADFKLVESRRPLEPLKRVLRGEAECALIDDSQLEAASHIEQGGELKPVWKSAELPGMAVVAFPRADAAAVASFKRTLGNLCSTAREACTTVGIEQLKPAGDERYRAVLDAYGK